ncbi:MAG: hypothetical protein EHM77_05335 [Planctomycetaceae bacterium]|nr:MAG: hypothetical protein EHM77_05335 [Planctomycetaceae bacterium]
MAAQSDRFDDSALVTLNECNACRCDHGIDFRSHRHTCIRFGQCGGVGCRIAHTKNVSTEINSSCCRFSIAKGSPLINLTVPWRHGR